MQPVTAADVRLLIRAMGYVVSSPEQRERITAWLEAKLAAKVAIETAQGE